MAIIVNKLGGHITAEIPQIFDAVFECTLNMINKVSTLCTPSQILKICLMWANKCSWVSALQIPLCCCFWNCDFPLLNFACGCYKAAATDENASCALRAVPLRTWAESWNRWFTKLLSDPFVKMCTWGKGMLAWHVWGSAQMVDTSFCSGSVAQLLSCSPLSPSVTTWQDNPYLFLSFLWHPPPPFRSFSQWVGELGWGWGSIYTQAPACALQACQRSRGCPSVKHWSDSQVGY